MQITLYSGIRKRENSTSLPPAASTSYTITGAIRNNCSVSTPTIEFQSLPGNMTSPAGLNYAHIPNFNRYYFIKDWEWQDRLWVARMECDVLASFITEIDNTYAYVERAYQKLTATGVEAYFDGNLIDNLYPAKQDFLTMQTGLPVPWNGITEQNGIYILGVIDSPSGYAGGAVSYYVLTHAAMGALVSYLLGDQFYTSNGYNAQNYEQVSLQLAKCILNPLEYITSCTWFPCTEAVFGNNLSGLSQIAVGVWITPTTIAEGKYIMSNPVYRQSYEVALPTHPLASSRGSYLNKPPYTTHTVILPPFGSFPIDATYFNGGDTRVQFTAIVDGITGKAILEVGAVNPDTLAQPKIFYQTNTQFGVPIQLAQQNPSLLAMTKSVINLGAGVAQMATGSHTSQQIGGEAMALHSIGNGLDSLSGQIISQGLPGSFASFDIYAGGQWPTMLTKFATLVDDDFAENGRPLCKVERLGNLRGYIKCGECTANFSAMADEKAKIKTFLLNGYYRE